MDTSNERKELVLVKHFHHTWFFKVKVIDSFELSDIDLWMLYALQMLFTISTLATVVVYVFLDIRIIMLQAQRRIQREIENK